jgi:ribosomal protein S21
VIRADDWRPPRVADAPLVRLAPGELVDRVLKKFSRKVERAGILRELHRRAQFTPPGERRRLKARRARKKKRAAAQAAAERHEEETT